MTPQEMVLEFHEVFGCPIRDRRPSVIQSRRRLLDEEHLELSVELVDLRDGYDNSKAVAKELADLAYILHGTAVALGIDLDKAIALVHESNMSKLGADGKPILREDGKVLKGPNYFEPDMTEAVR